VVFSRKGCAVTILALPATAKLPPDSLVALLKELLDLVPEGERGSLTIYATYEHFCLDRAQPDLYHVVGLGEVISRHTDEEETYAEDIANDVMQVGDPLAALEHCCRIVSYVPDLVRSPSFVDNLRLLQATAQIKGADAAQLQSCKEFLDERLDAQADSAIANVVITWKVPYAFGDEAPLIHGVPAGYVVPSTYIRSEGLTQDELMIVYFLLLLFSSAFRRMKPNPSEWQLMRHSMLQSKVNMHWKKASAKCQSYLIEFYRQVSDGRSLTEDMSLDTEE
jgi:hypothetical protein